MLNTDLFMRTNTYMHLNAVPYLHHNLSCCVCVCLWLSLTSLVSCFFHPEIDLSLQPFSQIGSFPLFLFFLLFTPYLLSDIT